MFEMIDVVLITYGLYCSVSLFVFVFVFLFFEIVLKFEKSLEVFLGI